MWKIFALCTTHAYTLIHSVMIAKDYYFLLHMQCRHLPSTSKSDGSSSGRGAKKDAGDESSEFELQLGDKTYTWTAVNFEEKKR